METQEISYNQIFKTISNYLISDTEIELDESDIYPSAKLSKLKIDTATKIQIIKFIEEAFKIQIDDKKITSRKLANLHQFCLALYYHINKKEEPISQQINLWQRIKEHFSKNK